MIKNEDVVKLYFKEMDIKGLINDVIKNIYDLNLRCLTHTQLNQDNKHRMFCQSDQTFFCNDYQKKKNHWFLFQTFFPP